MRKRYLAGAIIFLMLISIGVVIANIPAPPVNQQLGLYDTKFLNVSVDHSTSPSTPYACRDCHQVAEDIHHAMLNPNATTNQPNTAQGCTDCHPTVLQPTGQWAMTFSKNCHDCHDGTPFWANPQLNLTTIRGSPGRPHHNTSKQSSTSIVNAVDMAAKRQCVSCHGNKIASYNDGHYVPNYNTTMITPMADFKINASLSPTGKAYGGCESCHDESAASVPFINGNHDTHHYEVLSATKGAQCNYCHVSQGSRAEPTPDFSPEPSASPLRIWFNASYLNYVNLYSWDTSQRHVEVRNNTIFTYGNNGAGDAINGTGCEKCHDAQTLHNIEGAAPGMSQQQTVEANISGYGHIGNDSDCNGCHEGWRGASTNPFAGATSVELGGVNPGTVDAGTSNVITLTGVGFVQDGYNTTVLVDGNSINPDTISDSQITVTVPALSVGEHTIQVQKAGATTATSMVLTLTAKGTPPTISLAELDSNVLTITGTNFGTTDMKNVIIAKADGSSNVAATTSWSDTLITADGTNAAVGDTVTVATATGTASATIVAGATPTPTPTPAPVLTSVSISPSSATVRIGNTQTFTATALDQYNQPMQGIAISWTSSEIRYGTVNPATSTTGIDGTATTTFTATMRQGTTIVRASSGSYSASATVTVSPR